MHAVSLRAAMLFRGESENIFEHTGNKFATVDHDAYEAFVIVKCVCVCCMCVCVCVCVHAFLRVRDDHSVICIERKFLSNERH